MPLSRIQSESMNLGDDFAFTGTVTGAGGVQWSGGDGTYTDNDTSLSVTYTPSAT